MPTATGGWQNLKPWQKVAGVLAVLVVIGIIGSATNKTTSTTSSSTTPTSFLPAKPAISGSERAARDYINQHDVDVTRVQASVLVVQIGVGQLQTDPSQVNLNDLAVSAQRAHDNIDGIRHDFASTTSDSGTLGAAQLEVYGAANDLKNSMGALVAYAGDSNPATLAHFTTVYQRAVGEWNDGVGTIWRAARRRHPPTL